MLASILALEYSKAMEKSMILPLDPADPSQVRAAACLHETLLPESPVPGLGRFFMTKFYYRELVRAGLIRCDLFKSGDRYVALSVYTKDPFTFMEAGKRRFFFWLIFVLGVSVAAKPVRIGILWKMARRSQKRDAAQDQSVGEYLSLGVLPDYANACDAGSGLRAAHALLAKVMDYFRREGRREIYLVIEKQNRLAFRFYENYRPVPKTADFVPEHCVHMSHPVTVG